MSKFSASEFRGLRNEFVLLEGSRSCEELSILENFIWIPVENYLASSVLKI